MNFSHMRSREAKRTMGWDEELKTAVRKKRWKEMSSLLKDNDYSRRGVELFITECEQNSAIPFDREILSQCSEEQKDRLLKTALKKFRPFLGGGSWKEVKVLLEACIYSSSSVEQLVIACEKYEKIPVDREILSHCSEEQKDRLLKTALKPGTSGINWNRERWPEVKVLLQDCDYSSSSVEQFVTACEQRKMIHVDGEILSHCTSEQKDRLLKTAVKLCNRAYYFTRWNEVKILLQASSYSSSSVEQFVAACEEYDVIHVDPDILSRCTSEQKDRLLKTGVKLCSQFFVRRSDDLWNDVKILLQDTNYSSSNVEQFVTACEQYGVIHVDLEILSHCTSQQRKRLLDTAVKTERWVEVKALLEGSGYSSIVVEEFVTACEQCGVIHVTEDIVSHCTSEQHGRLLETGLRKMMWEGVDGLLQYLHYGASFVEQFVTACEMYDVVHDCPGLLSHCTTQQLDRLLTLATTLKQWSAVGKLLEAGGSHEKRLWVIEQACEMSDCQSILPHLDDDFLSLCNTQQLDRLLTAFTKKRRWEIVEQVFKAGGSHEKRVWAIEQSCDVVNNVVYNGWENLLRHVDEDFLSQCNTQQLDRLLTAFTTIKRWQIVGKVLKSGGSHENRVWAIEQASLTCQRYDRNFDNYYYDDDDHDDHFMMYILPHINDDFLSQCSSQQLDRLLTTFTTKGRWQLADPVLKAGGSHEKRVWAITQACDKHIYCYMLSHITNDLLTNCTTEQLDTLLTTVTRNRWWDIIDKVLRAGGSHGKRVCVFKEACQTADHLDFQRYILPHCDGQLYNHITNPHTQSGFTVLFSAMLNEHCPQRMVAECIRLGFSTHQPPTVMPTPTDIAETVTRAWMRGWENATVSSIITSPFLLAVLRGMPVVAHMLYESGSSSYPELLHLYTVLLDLSDPHTEDGRKLNEGEYLTDWERLYSLELFSEQYKALMKTLTTFLPYLREMASTPRSLASSCCLVISHCLTGGGGRDKTVKELHLPKKMKDYLLFSDLNDPDYQPLMYRTT